jgi:hypothetical protein
MLDCDWSSDVCSSDLARRQVLLDLLRGPPDWTTAAAITALGELAVREPDALPEVRAELIDLGWSVVRAPLCTFGATLAVTARKVPFFAPDLARALTERWLVHPSLDPRVGASTQPPDEPTPQHPWWKFWA